MSQEALAVQVRKEDERWMREQRQTAYHAMIRADMRQTTFAEAVRGQATGWSNSLPPELTAEAKEVNGEAFAALSLIELCGPQSVLDAAKELYSLGGNMGYVYSRPSDQTGETDPHYEVYSRHVDALKAFREAAREALGYGEYTVWYSSP
ncbi:hypothetical protein ABZ379_33955 [Streptomyces canus]|uniref:hypothetical protein n=1 Tax=Streptomyces canus TaxID=58343 RepID=UPI0033C1D263